MRTNRFLAISAIALLGISACQKPELESELTSGATHTVTFVAGTPETKTTVDISDGKTAKFAWTDEDVDRFTVYENGIEATEVIAELGTDGKMSMMATFPGELPASPKYQALYNTEVSATQIVPKNSYAEISDVMVSNVLDGTRDKLFQFSFKREVAFAKMTLKGLTSGAYVSSVTIESDKPIAGQYDLETGTFVNTSNVITLDVLNDVVAGNATVWFTTIPVEEAKFTIKAKTTDDAETVAGTYTKTFTKTITLTRGDVKGFGVAMEKDAVASPNETYNRITSQSELEGGEYVIGMALNSDPNTIKYLVNTTKTKPGCIDITGDISISEDGKTIKLNPTTITNAKWLIESVEGGFSISSMTENPAGLATTKDNDGLTTQTTYLGKAWSITVDGETNACTMKFVPTSRYLNVYSLTNPRTYTSSTTNNNGKIYLYKKYDSRTTLTAPTNLAVNSETKLVSWTAVDGAASYVLTIGTEEYPCTSNSYDAKDIADEYYDVAVVAVPSDTENYKNSAAATLPDAKFGTPTLPTPTISAGVLEETSVAFSWTKDARATNGYHWALYNGEILIKEADETSATTAEVTGLVFGTTYTAKVYALAVDGDKPYVQSSTASFDLTTKAKTTISTIFAAGTGTTKYAIADLTVMAVNGSNFVVKDETGLMFCYKYGATVGDVVTLEGTFEEYQGLKEFKATTYKKASTASVDYGTATELNSSNVAAYVKNPVVQYVKAKATVASDGSLKVGDVALYQYGNSLASYAGRTINLYGYTLGYNTERSNIVLLQTSVEIDQTVPYLAVEPTSKTWSSDETTAAVFNVTTNTEGVKDWAVTPNTLDWATIAVDEANGTITVTPKDKNTTDTAREATLTVTHSAGTLSKTITLTQSAAGDGEAVVKTYQHVFTTKPSTGNNVTLSGVSWNISATNLNAYNSNNYAGVQIGTSSKNGQINLTSPSAWSYTADGVTVTKIKEVRLWLNLGGTSVTPSVSIGGNAAISDGTTVTKNSTAGTDWTKATKVTFTPAAGSDTGVIVIDVTSVKAGYICAIEIDAE